MPEITITIKIDSREVSVNHDGVPSARPASVANTPTPVSGRTVVRLPGAFNSQSGGEGPPTGH
jgi:hypothetical protein